MVLYTPGQSSGYPRTEVKEGIRFHFLGGGNEVGNVGCVIEDNTADIANFIPSTQKMKTDPFFYFCSGISRRLTWGV